MDNKKIGDILNLNPKALSTAMNKIANMSELEFIRSASKVEDKEALTKSNIERITLFFHGADKDESRNALLIKPIEGMTDKWMVNLRALGTLNINLEKPEFEIVDIAGEHFRFSINSTEFKYWVDLIDEKQAQDLATFLSIGITPHELGDPS